MTFQPQALGHAPRARRRAVDVLILGAGLAGTSLALHLRREGFGGGIALVDARRDFSREARWCSWGDIPAPLDECVTHRWNAWRVKSGARHALQGCTSRPYSEIHAPTFFARFHAELAASADVSLCLGHAADGWSEVDGRVQISTGEGAERTHWDAGWVFDARGLEMARWRRLTASNPPLNSPRAPLAWTQKFVGQVLSFDRPTFDPQVVTLMDFDVPQSARGVRFAYVLPFSDRRALVEMTAFSPVAVCEDELESALQLYNRSLGGQFAVEAWERGEVPMNTQLLGTKLGVRVGAIGAVGGAIRPATGYGFGRIQRQTKHIARALTAGQNPLEASQSAFRAAKYGAMDAIFLRALDNGPDFARDCFLRMFERVEPAALTRFMGEASTWRDEIALVGALPKMAFLGAALGVSAPKPRQNREVAP